MIDARLTGLSTSESRWCYACKRPAVIQKYYQRSTRITLYPVMTSELISDNHSLWKWGNEVISHYATERFSLSINSFQTPAAADVSHIENLGKWLEVWWKDENKKKEEVYWRKGFPIIFFSSLIISCCLQHPPWGKQGFPSTSLFSSGSSSSNY